MRSNLAMVDASLRRSTLEATNYKGEDLGFLGTKPGADQMNTHNRSTAVIVVALLFQALKNYSDMKRISARLEDPSLENFLNGLKNKNQFIDGMNEDTKRTVSRQ